MSLIVAIDGPAGSGKGTIAKEISKRAGLLNVDTGAMFRCVALEMIRNGVSLEETSKVQEILDTIKIELKVQNESLAVFLNGEDVSKQIRTEEVSKYTSPVSAIGIVREKLLKLQREYALSNDIVMEGRDIGTVVFPDADVKIYLDATPEERARRRVKQNDEKGISSEYEKVLEEIKIRDKRDMTREIAPLKKAVDAIYIDSTDLNTEEVIEKILKIVNSAKVNN